MKVGLTTPISSYHFKEFLYPESAAIAEHLSENFAPSVTNLAVDILKRGHSMVVYTKDPVTHKRYTLRGPNLTVYVTPALHQGWYRVLNKLHINELRLIFSMLRHREKMDVLSVHWTREYAIGARFFLKRCPVTVTVRDIIPLICKMQYINWTIKLTTAISMRDSRFHFIANSEYTKAMVKHYWKQESIVINNGISDLFLDYQPQEPYKDFTFVSITVSIDGRKNITKLMEAFKIIHDKTPNTRLILIGPKFIKENPYVQEWEQNNLLEGVELAGSKSRSEIKTILTKAHCLVHPSIEETFGNILVEAMACKSLVIGGRDAGAVPYVLKHGECGLLCDVTDSDDIAQAMQAAMSNDYTEMKEQAFQAVQNEYCGDKICSDYLSYFETVIADFNRK